MLEYQVETIEKATPEQISEQGNWHRYTITAKDVVITGYRNDMLEEVQNYVQECITRLNNKYK